MFVYIFLGRFCIHSTILLESRNLPPNIDGLHIKGSIPKICIFPSLSIYFGLSSIFAAVLDFQDVIERKICIIIAFFSDQSNLSVLQADLSRLREEIKDITISKNKVIEESHARIVSLEKDLNQIRDESQLKLTELQSQLEQTR